jgi:hypothetical protein
MSWRSRKNCGHECLRWSARSGRPASLFRCNCNRRDGLRITAAAGRAVVALRLTTSPLHLHYTLTTPRPAITMGLGHYKPRSPSGLPDSPRPGGATDQCRQRSPTGAYPLLQDCQFGSLCHEHPYMCKFRTFGCNLLLGLDFGCGCCSSLPTASTARMAVGAGRHPRFGQSVPFQVGQNLRDPVASQATR